MSMQTTLQTAAALILLVGIAHSYLGERYILMRLFRRSELPALFGGTKFTQHTLRFAWHLTTLAWLGLAGVLLLIAADAITPHALGLVVGTTFLVHGAVALLASRGKHLSWPVFLIIGLLVISVTRV